MLFVNGHILCRAVHLAGAGDHHALGAQLTGSIQHIQGALDVGVNIAVRAVIAEGNGNQRCQMEHALLAAHSGAHTVGVTHIAGENFDLAADLFGQSIDPAKGAKRVVQAESGHLFAAFHQLFGKVAADKAIGAGDQNTIGHKNDSPFVIECIWKPAAHRGAARAVFCQKAK